MKWLGYRQFAVARLKLPGDIRARMEKPHVIELAADIRELGGDPMNAPVFRDNGDLVAGRDRMAATLLNKAKKVWAHVAQCTDQEAADLEVSENLYRRPHNRDELIAKRVRKVAETIETTRRAGGTNVPASQTVKAEARKKVARETGITPAAVRKAEQRAADFQKKTGAGTEAGEAPTPAPVATCPVETYGVEVAPHFSEHVTDVIEIIDEADHLLRRVQAMVTKLASQRFPVSLYQRLKEDCHRAAHVVRMARPFAVCPWCKDTRVADEREEDCSACEGRGFIVQEQADNVPKELRKSGVVARDGRFVPATSKSQSKRLRVQTVGEDGSERDYEPGDAA